MGRLVVGIFLLGIASGVVAFEVYLNQDMFEKAVPLQQEPRIIPNANTPPAEQPEAPSAPLSESQVRPQDHFDLDALAKQGIVLKDGIVSTAIFRHAQLEEFVDPFYLVTFLFEDNGETIGTVSRVVPTEEMSDGRLLSLVRKKLFNAIPQEESSLINLSESLNTRGEANFYLNDNRNFPNIVFLVTRSGTKVLAMQFPREYNDRVAQILPLFFE